MVAPLGRRSGREISHLLSSQLQTWHIMVVAILGNTNRSRVVTSMSPWKYRWNLTVWTRWKLHVQSLKKIGNIRKGIDYLSGFKVKINAKKKEKSRYTIISVSNKDLSKSIREFEILPYESYESKRPKHKPTISNFYLER